jgi:hypothetical protein
MVGGEDKRMSRAKRKRRKVRQMDGGGKKSDGGRSC